MPEISEHKRKNVKRRKSGCCASICCFFPRKKAREDYLESVNKSVESCCPTILDKPPHLDHLPEPVSVGSCITVRGFIRPECKRFAVNFLCGPTDDSDIAVHINPRIAQRYIVRNSRIQGKWGPEETTSITKFELSRNEKFLIDVVVTESEFLVSINGKHVCAYVFRVAVSRITTIMVDGAVDVESVQYKKLEIYPQIDPQNAPYTVPTGDGHDKDAVENQLTVPVTAVLPKGFPNHWQLEITGRAKILPSSFYINLQRGSQLWPHPIVPLHLNPRFNKFVFIRNAWLGGKWGKEERSNTFPFAPGDKFSLVIRKYDDHFSVWVNGQLCGEFLFRDDVDDIDTVYIHGDVTVRSLYMRDHIDDKYFSNSQTNLKKVSL